MKLRNKKTGVIIEPDRIAIIKNTKETNTASYNRIAANYRSLAQLNNEWEDYNPKEPLIVYEGIRKIIRLWAKLNEITELTYNYTENSFEDIFRNTITFNPALGLEDGHSYTIAELCGEEEE